MSQSMLATLDLVQMVSAMPTGVTNPFDGMLPNFDFGEAFNALWKRVFAGLWAFAIIITVGFIVMNIVKAGKGSSSSNPHEVSQARGGVKTSLSAFAALIALMPLLAVIFYVL